MFKSLLRINLTYCVSSHIPVINSLRGLASLLVCVFHLVCLPINFLENTIIYQLAPLGRYGVQIFFVITGIVIPMLLINGNYKYSLFGRFILKRIIRIEPPYLFTILSSIVFILFRNQSLSKIPQNIPSTQSLLLHIGYLIPFIKGEKWFIIVFWTMAVEFQYYIIVSLLFPLLIARKLVTRIVSYFVIFSLSVTFTSGEFAISWMPVFMIGIIYVSFLFVKVNKLELWIVLCTSFCFSAFLHGFSIALIAIITLAVVHFFYNYKSSIGNFFGRISYSLYLTHTVFGTAAINFFVPYISSLSVKFLVVLLGFAVSVVTAYFFNVLIEQPFQKYASKISLKPKPLETQNRSITSAEKYKLNY